MAAGGRTGLGSSGRGDRSARYSGRPPRFGFSRRYGATRPSRSAWSRGTIRAAGLGSGRVRTTRLLLARHRRSLAACLLLVALWVTIRTAATPPPATVAVLIAAHDLPAGSALTADDVRQAPWPADGAPGGRLAVAAGRVLASPIRAGELLTDARVLGPGLLAGQAQGTVAMPIRLADPTGGAMLQAGDRVDVLASTSSAASDWASTSSSNLADGTDGAPGSGSSSSGAGRENGGGAPGGARSTGSDSAARRVATGALVLAVPPPTSGADGESSATGTQGGGLGGLSGLASSAAGASTGTQAGVIVLAVSSFEAARLAAAQNGTFLAIALLPHR
jgi:Flp pilus assembly protein CpaB